MNSRQSAAAAPELTGRDERGFTLIELIITMIIVMATVAITTSALVKTQQNYAAQRERMETANQARAAMDAMTRLIRMSGANPMSIAMTPIAADPDANNAYDSIRIQADWNPADGDIADPYENITFSVVNNQLMKREPADAADVLFADNVQSLLFTYQNTNEAAIANPVASAASIAFVTVGLTTRSTAQVQDGPPLVLTSSVAVRRTE